MVASIRNLRNQYFLFLDVLALKLSITIIISRTYRPEKILPTARSTKN